jgi:ferric-dicitrate binding protein FerR (iron transport regulator)
MAQETHNLPVDVNSRMRHLAWAVLLAAFLTFCAITLTAGYSGWRYVSEATTTQRARLLADVPVGVAYQPRGSAEFRAVDRGGSGVLGEGDQVRIASASSAGYGKVASIELADGSSLDLRAGSQVALHTYRRARWLGRNQQIAVVQTNGYVRYNLQQDDRFDTTVFTVDPGSGVVIELAVGGSYSVNVRPPTRTLRVASADQSSVLPDQPIEVAVRGSGQATVRGAGHSVVVLPGQLVTAVSGVPQEPVAARWELVRDNAFDRYANRADPGQIYNNTTIDPAPPMLERSDTWQVRGQAIGGPQPKTSQGQFGVVRECLAAQSSPECPLTYAARFLRTGNQTQPFITSIYQDLGDAVVPPDASPATQGVGARQLVREGIDVTEYRQLVLSADLRILNQSLDKGGQAGQECPLLLRIEYRKQSPTDNDEQVFCFWYKDGPNGTLAPDEPGYFQSQQVTQYEWYPFKVDLRDAEYLPEARFIRRISIEARGHDYNAQIANISLVGTQ